MDQVQNSLTDRYVERPRPRENVHAERLVLEHINNAWRNKYEKNFLLLYTYLSPCAHRCANPDKPLESILELIPLMTNWPQHALVFQQPYTRDKEDNLFSDDEVETSLKALAEKIGYANIFRCYRPGNTFQCIRCFPEQNKFDGNCIESAASGAGAKRSHSPDPGISAKTRRVSQ